MSKTKKNIFQKTDVSKGLIGDSVGSGRPPKVKTAQFYERQIAKREEFLKTAQSIVGKRKQEVAEHISKAKARGEAFVTEAEQLVVTVEASISKMREQYREHLVAEQAKLQAAIEAA